MKPWKDYFRFETGTEIKVDGPLKYDGVGKVLERTTNTLELEINLPQYDLLHIHIPATQLVVKATCSNEGPGNEVMITYAATGNGNSGTASDDNATVVSGPVWRKIIPSVQVPDYNLESVAFMNDKKHADEVDFRIEYDGRTYKFNLIRT